MQRWHGLAAAALLAAGCTPTPGPTTSGTTSGVSGATGATSVGPTATATAAAAGSSGGTTIGGVGIGAIGAATGTSGVPSTTSSAAATTSAGSTASSTSTSTTGTSSTTTSSTSTSSTSSTGTTGASACAGLVPAAPGAPVTHVVAPAQQACGGYDSDGSGTLYLEHYDNLTERVDVVTPQGASVATAQGGKYMIQPDAQLSGMLGIAQGEGGASLFRVAADGTLTLAASGFGIPMQANDPTGGVVLFDNGVSSSQVALYAFDANGSQRWKIQYTAPNLPSARALGVDRQGNILVLQNDTSGLHGFWVDHAGAQQPDFQLMTSAAVGALGFSSVSFSLAPQVGSGLFLRAGDSGASPDPNSKWIRAIGTLSTDVQPAPAWLASRAGTELQLIHGGTGYAVTALQPSLSTCTQGVEIIASDGTDCGTASFSLGTAACTAKPLKVGYDGSVIQALPDAMETCAAQGQCSCTWRWWPAYFR